MAEFKVLSWYFLRGTEENCEKSQSGEQASGPRLETEPPEYEARFFPTRPRRSVTSLLSGSNYKSETSSLANKFIFLTSLRHVLSLFLNLCITTSNCGSKRHAKLLLPRLQATLQNRPARDHLAQIKGAG